MFFLFWSRVTLNSLKTLTCNIESRKLYRWIIKQNQQATKYWELYIYIFFSYYIWLQIYDFKNKIFKEVI